MKQLLKSLRWRGAIWETIPTVSTATPIVKLWVGSQPYKEITPESKTQAHTRHGQLLLR